MYRDFIIIYWVDPGQDKTQWTKEFQTFLDHIEDNRYVKQDQWGKMQSKMLSVIDMYPDIKSQVGYWVQSMQKMDACRPVNEEGAYGGKAWHEEPATLWFGFQGDPGWTDPDFFDILDTVEGIPQTLPNVTVQWLPDNWFMHQGLCPPHFGSADDVNDWLNLQTGEEVEQFEYEQRPLQWTGEAAPF